MISYPALIRKESNSDFGVEFPDFPGCVAAAPTVNEALHQAEEALRFHVDGMLEDGTPIPEPTALEQVLEEAASSGAAAYLVRLLPEKGRAVRVNITIDENLLADIDGAAREKGMSRSAFLADAARYEIDPFLRRLREAIPRGGHLMENLRRMIDEDNKRRWRKNHPPKVHKIGKPG